MLQNRGQITLDGEGSNIVIGKDLHNCGVIRSNAELFCRRIHREGELDVEDVIEKHKCIKGPDNLFERNYGRRISDATYIFSDSGEVTQDGEIVGYGEFTTGGVTFRWDGDEWIIEGQGYIRGSAVFESGVKMNGAWVDLLGDLSVNGALIIDSESTLILQSIEWPGLLVRGMLRVDGYGRFNTGIYTGQMMTGFNAEVEIYGGLFVAHNLHNKGKMKVKFSQMVMRRIAERIKQLEDEEDKQLLSVQYADGITMFAGAGIAIFASRRGSLDEIMAGEITDVSYRILGTTRKLGVDLGGGLVPPQVIAYGFIENLKQSGYKQPVLLKLYYLPPDFFYGEFMDASDGEYIGIYQLGDGYRKVDKAFFEEVEMDLEKWYASLPVTISEEWQHQRDLEWEEFLRPVSGTASFGTESRLLNSKFGTMSFLGGCYIKYDHRYTVTGFKKWKVLDENLWDSLYQVIFDASSLSKGDYKIGCSPVSAALIFRYWGWRNSNYNSCLPDNRNLLIDLHKAMKTTDDGGTENENIAPGIKSVAQKYGMEFRTGGKEFWWKSPYNFIRDEILRDRPVHHSYYTAKMLKKGMGHSAVAYGVRHVKRVYKTSIGTNDSLCADRHYVEIIYSAEADYEENPLGFGEHRLDIWAAPPGWYDVVVIPVHGCPSGGGGGGGGGGCSETPGQDEVTIFFAVYMWIFLVKRRTLNKKHR